MSGINALILTEGWQGALACIQSLGRRGHRIICCVSPSPSPNASSKYVADRIPIVAPREPPENRAKALKRAITEHKIDVVIPISDDDALLVATARELFPGMRAIVAPPLRSVNIARDKILTLELAREIHVRTPHSIIVDQVGELDDAIARIGFPAVIKVPISTASAGVTFVRSSDEVRRARAKLPHGRVLVQEFVEGEFVGVTGFAVKSSLIDSFAFRSRSQTSGTPPYAFTLDDSRVNDILQLICERLEWTGGIDLDLLRGASGDLFLLEINPRLSGTLVFADKMGIDLPRLYVDLIEGTELLPVPPRPPIEDMLFISVVPEEIALISRQPSLGQQNAARLRGQHRYVESLYYDDGPLLAAQLRQAVFIAWNTPRS